MATIDFSFTHPAASFSKTYTIPDGHLVRLIAAYRLRFGAETSNADVLARLTDMLMSEMKEATLSAERNAATAAVAPISAT